MNLVVKKVFTELATEIRKVKKAIYRPVEIQVTNKIRIFFGCKAYYLNGAVLSVAFYQEQESDLKYPVNGYNFIFD